MTLICIFSPCELDFAIQTRVRLWLLLYSSGCCGSSEDNRSGEINLEHWFSSKAVSQKALVILPLEIAHQTVAINHCMGTFGQIHKRHKSCIRDLVDLELGQKELAFSCCVLYASFQIPMAF